MATKKDKEAATADQPTKEKDFYAMAKVSPELFGKIKAEADRQGVATSAIIRQALTSFVSGEKPPVKAEVVEALLAKIEGRVADLDRRIDACAIAAVRVGDRVAAIAATPKP